MRLSQFAKKYSVNEETLEKYFKELKWRYSSINKKLTDVEIEKLLEHHKIPAKKLMTTGYIIENNLTKDFKIPNKFREKIGDFLKGGFNQKKIDGTDNFHLDDFTAITICDGLKNQDAKLICRRYYNGDVDELLITSAHKLAIETIERYGKEVILELIKLPKLPFKVTNFHQVFTELDKKRGQILDPSIRIMVNNEPIHISFYKEGEKDKKILFRNIVEVRNRNTREVLFKLTRQGDCMPQSKGKGLIPMIQTFVSYSSEMNQHILHYGLVTGECSICGRPLSDPESIRIGIGPICRQGLL
jgi:hypothetical protein